MERSSPRYPMYTERDPGRRKWVARTGRDDGRGLKTRRLELVCFFIFYFTLLTYCIQLSPPFQYPTKTTVGFRILLLMNGYFTGFCRVRPPPSTQMQQQQQQGLKSFYFSNSMYVYFYIIITY